MLLIYCIYDRCELSRPEIGGRRVRLMRLVNVNATYICDKQAAYLDKCSKLDRNIKKKFKHIIVIFVYARAPKSVAVIF